MAPDQDAPNSWLETLFRRLHRFDSTPYVHPLQRRLGKLPLRWRWAPHNLVGHPLSEVIYQLGLRSLGHYVHDITVPEPQGEEPRG